jgi:hypothetical protein
MSNQLSNPTTFDLHGVNFAVVIESERELERILQEDVRDGWIDFPALDNALYFKLHKFTMHDRRYKAIFYGNHAFIKPDETQEFVPCGYFSIGKARIV